MTKSPTNTIPEAVSRFLAGLETGRWDGMHELLAPNVVYDASVPGWRSRYLGAERVLREYAEEWTAHPWRLVEHHVGLTSEGAVVDLEARGRCPGDAHHGPHEEAVRMANIFRLVDGRIAEHRVYCCGEWDETTIRRIDTEAPTIDMEATP